MKQRRNYNVLRLKTNGKYATHCNIYRYTCNLPENVYQYTIPSFNVASDSTSMHTLFYNSLYIISIFMYIVLLISLPAAFQSLLSVSQINITFCSPFISSTLNFYLFKCSIQIHVLSYNAANTSLQIYTMQYSQLITVHIEYTYH